MNWTRGLILALSLSLAFTLGLLYRSDGQPLPPGPDYVRDAEIARQVARVLSDEGKGDLTFARVAKVLRPSVVSIHASAEFADSTGTGVILDREGHILTNLHVTEGFTDIIVSLSSGDHYRGEVIGRDEDTDLAVVKIPDSDLLLPISFGDSEDLLVGQQILAIGNAYGFGWSVSHGIISSLNRSDFEGKTYTDYIQTDAAINPGNSGGPLVDASGFCIGINSVIVSESGSSSGVGFALPASDARFVAEELIRSGKVERGYLGLGGKALAELSRKDRRAAGIDRAVGILVTYVRPRSPASTRFRSGDIILSMAGREVSTYDALRARVARTKPGKVVEFVVLRGGEEEIVRVPLAIRPPLDS